MTYLTEDNQISNQCVTERSPEKPNVGFLRFPAFGINATNSQKVVLSKHV